MTNIRTIAVVRRLHRHGFGTRDIAVLCKITTAQVRYALKSPDELRREREKLALVAAEELAKKRARYMERELIRTARDLAREAGAVEIVGCAKRAERWER